MTNQSRLRVGVIGAGVGKAHLRGYQTLTDTVEIAALCDVNEARLQTLADMYDIPHRYTSTSALYEAGMIDAVSICVPNNLHTPLSIAALEAGIHVLCEKPLAESVASAQTLVEAVARSNRKFMMAYTRRYRADLIWLKQALKDGVLGEIYQVKTGWTRETGIPGWGGWFTNKEMAGGGPLIDLGIHMLDAALWLLDYPDPQTVSGAVYANFGPRRAKTWGKIPATTHQTDYTVEDSATAFIRLSGDVTLQAEVSWASHARPGMDDFYITLMGTEGTAEMYVQNYAKQDTLTLYTEVGGVPVVTKPDIRLTTDDHTTSVTEFVSCILNDTPPTTTAEQGLIALKIVEAIYTSAAQRSEVQFVTTEE